MFANEPQTVGQARQRFHHGVQEGLCIGRDLFVHAFEVCFHRGVLDGILCVGRVRSIDQKVTRVIKCQKLGTYFVRDWFDFSHCSLQSVAAGLSFLRGFDLFDEDLARVAIITEVT